jgi:hypothetical protein
MTNDDPIGDELDKLSAEFRKLAGLPKKGSILEAIEQLTRFGLTINEARIWLRHEPNFSSDASYHEPRNRRKVNRTEKSYCLNIETRQE